MSSLKKYQKDPKNLLNTALVMYKSKQLKTAIVEGVCDKRFLSQWVSDTSSIRYDGLDGKLLVDRIYIQSQSKPYCEYKFLYFFADVDYDIITKKKLTRNPDFIYNAYCNESNNLIYNDLETFLINTKAFNKILVNLDIDEKQSEIIRNKLELASRFIGSLRAADIIVQERNMLSSSILNGFEIKSFFNAKDISFNQNEVFKALPKWSNYPLYIDELIEVAGQLNTKYFSKWALTRGHDATEMLSLYFFEIGHRSTSKEKIELMLRLACELTDYLQSPMGKQFTPLNSYSSTIS